MRSGDVDILIIPGWGNSGEDHWQSRWERNLRTARRVEQESWDLPERDAWTSRIRAAVATAQRPAVLVGHSLGVAAIVHAARVLPDGLVAGAFLVGPSDLDAMASWPVPEGRGAWPPAVAGFAPMPMTRLPFTTRVIASSNDPFCTIERAQAFAAAWGGDLSIITNAGHINTDSGHGPWPDGLLTFGMFLKKLG
jgi:predicted alpha/beta hydrolase family esterase